MNVKARKIFFYFFIVVFIVGGAYLIVSAQGLTFDFQTLTFSRTGGLFLNYTPSGAEVRMNGVVRDYSSIINTLFGNGVFLNNLVPGNYTVEVEYPGYAPWQKTLMVKPGVVTAASSIILWPVNWNAKKISDYTVSDFWLTGNGLVLKTDPNTLTFGKKTIKGSTVLLNDNGRDAIVTGDAKGYYLTNLGNASSSTMIILPKGVKIDYWFFHPFDQNAVLAVGNKEVYSVSLTTGAARPLYAIEGDTNAYENGNELFIAESNGDIFSVNPLLRTDVTMTTGISGTITSMKSNSDGSILYLVSSNGNLYEYDRSNQTTTLAESSSSPAWSISPSLDGTRLAVISKNGDCSMFAVTDYKMDEEVAKGASWQIRHTAPVTDFLWIPSASNYGIFLESSMLMVSELDERTPQNQYEIESDVSKALVNGNTLYFIKDGSLFEINLSQK